MYVYISLTSNRVVSDQYIHFILVYILYTTGMTNLMMCKCVPEFFYITSHFQCTCGMTVQMELIPHLVVFFFFFIYLRFADRASQYNLSNQLT